MTDDQFTPEEQALIDRLSSAPQPHMRSNAFDAIRQQVLAEVSTPTNLPPTASSSVPPSYFIILVIIVVVAIIIAVILINQNRDTSVTITPVATEEMTPEITPDLTVEATESTSEVTPETTPEITPESTPTIEIQSNPDVDTHIVLEGPIQAIDGNMITVFDMIVQLDPDDPIQAQLAVGDPVRIEGNSTISGGNIVIIAVNIVIIRDPVINPPAQPPSGNEGSERGSGSGTSD